MKTRIWLVWAAAALLSLAPQEAMATGACTAARLNDWQKTCPLFAGVGSAPAPSSCSDCEDNKHGMPRWWVTEPYIDLCVADTPLSYTMSSGQEMDFSFFYKQRARMPEADESPITYNMLSRYESLFVGNPYPIGATCGSDAFWGHNWNMSVEIQAIPIPYDHYGASPVFSYGYDALVFNSSGTVDVYTNLNYAGQVCKDVQSQAILTDVAGQGFPNVYEILDGGFEATNTPSVDSHGISWGDAGIGVKLVYADGSQDIFGLSAYWVSCTYFGPDNPYLPDNTNSLMRLLLTQRIDPQGRATRLGYETITSPYFYSSYRLKYVVDPDGRTNQFKYTATNNVQLAEIDDPYSRKTTLAYNSFGELDQIVDAVKMTNGFAYFSTQVISNAIFRVDGTNNPYIVGYNSTLVSGNGWMSRMTTPYGTNQFCHYEIGETDVVDGVMQRALYIGEPEQAAQLYYYIHNAGALVPQSDTAPSVAGITNFDDGIAGGVSLHNKLYYRNSFHWGRRQFEATSTYVQNNLAFAAQNFNPSQANSYFANGLSLLVTNDYARARQRHWLWQSDNVSISDSLSSERAPSFDVNGQVPGLRTWYNYINKPDNGAEDIGNNPQIACIAKVLPDGSSQYTTYNFSPTNSSGAGLVSDNESTYTKADGSFGLLTNWFCYATNNIDLLSSSNSAGQYVNYGYNTNHQITAITNALNQVATLSWNPNLTGVQLPSGQNIALGYYAPASPTTSTSSLLQWTTIQPQGRCFTNNSYYAGLPTSIADDRGVTVQNTWDGLNRLTGTVFPDTTSISNVYNRLDLAAIKDRITNWTYYAYDGLQHLTNEINANQAVTKYSWCGCGSLYSITDALNNTNTFGYDNQGNLLNISFADKSSMNWQYDQAGRVTETSDGANHYLQFSYNIQGLMTNTANANGLVESIVYDALNRPISHTDANDVTVTNTFDAINELVRRTWPTNISEGFGYATNGLNAYTNRDGKATFYTRDGAGRKIAELNANQELTRFVYDSLDNLTNMWDGNTNQTRWQYNEYGWLTNKVDGLGRTNFRYAYNPNGWVTNRWTPEKGNTGYAYDNLGNLKSIFYPQLTINYGYNAFNRLTNMVDGVGTTAFSYTPAGQLQSENGPWTNDTVAFTYFQRFRTNLSLTQPVGTWSQGYSYDSGWRLQNLTSPAGSFGYCYNFQPASTLVTAITLPNAASITNGYDALGRLRVTALNNYWGHTLDSYSYGPDALGLRTNILRNLGLANSTVNVGFDNIGQLTSWSASETVGGKLRQNEQSGFGYDPAHNLHSRSNGGLSQSFTTDAANELTNVSRAGTFTLSGATPAPATNILVNGQQAQIYGDFTFARTNVTLTNGVNTFTSIASNIYGAAVTNTLTVNLPQTVKLGFDNNGNLTNDGVRTFGYDSENQLTIVFVPGQWRSDFIYDGLNRRRITRDFAWQSGLWFQTNEVHYIYDGYLLIQERDTNSNPLVTYTRSWDLSGSLQGAGGIGGLLARTDTNGSTFYHADASGNITALVDGRQNIVARYLYNPFGKVIGKWGPMADANEMQFSSMPHENLSGLSLSVFRPYDPNLQRFLNHDPIGERGGINLYGFVGNNPINYVDPLGLALYWVSSQPFPGQEGTYGPYLSQVPNVGGPDRFEPLPLFNGPPPNEALQSDDGILGFAAPELPIVGKGLGALGRFVGDAAGDLMDALGLAKLKVKCPTDGFPEGPGALRKPVYNQGSGHGPRDTLRKSRAPSDGQGALDNSTQVKDTSPRRIGVDSDGNFVVLDRDTIGSGSYPDIYHGHVRAWDDLEPEMQRALIRAGLATPSGKPIP